jgi:putative thioredoxin
MAIDVTDATFQAEVAERSLTTPVVVDLWAPWCEPCKALTPILERVVDATAGQVILAKVNVDENPGIMRAFGVQSIPTVVAIKDGKPVNAFMGAQPEHAVAEFVQQLLPSATELKIAELIASGTEQSLRDAVALVPNNEDAVCRLAEHLIKTGHSEEALQFLARLPETDRVRHLAAQARLAANPIDNYDDELTALLDRVKTDDAARQEYVDILKTMGSLDPRTAKYRKLLTSRLY